MQYSATQKFVASLGNYGEKYEASRTVTFSHHDLGYTDDEWVKFIRANDWETGMARLELAVITVLDQAVEEELDRAYELVHPDEDESFLLRLDPPSTETEDHPKTKTLKKRS